MNKSQLIDFLATGFYSGKSPIAPGTCGTIAALVIVSVLKFSFNLNPSYIVTIPLALLIIWLSIYVSNEALKLKLYGDNQDPNSIVIDEFAGFFVAISILPWTYFSFILAFLFFRLFDIKKFYPANRLEKLTGGYGITLDDVAAGVYAGAYSWVILLGTGGLNKILLDHM
ncbi:MAG: phosphatidylglycerophosphatase A [Deltaproteobacteria bacterium]|jgi:phosphatidylglycerophosphatase A|nr:phosphatidylglycerophosphatase A [Deltaproteobacteria bacterium]